MLKKSRVGVLPCVIFGVSFCFAVAQGAKIALRWHRRREEAARGERGRLKVKAETV
jgi:hypothetical protein